MAVDWSADGMLKWKEEAVKEQQGYCDTLGTPMWREFEPSHYINLKREIGFALFGVPEEEPCTNLNGNTGYTDKKLKHIRKMCDIIMKCMQNHRNPKNILVSFLFVCGKTSRGNITAPLIRIPQFDINVKQNIHLFIDSCGRVYKNWQDYLDNNTIQSCVLCCPRNGVYSAVDGVVEVEFGISPAGRTGAKVLQGFDIGGTILNMGAGGTLIAGLLFPVALPVVAGAVGVSMATGAYSVGRSIQTLVDRDQHQQTIGLNSSVSRNCWLGIVGGVMSFVSAGTTAAVAATTRGAAEIPLAGQIAIKSVTVGSSVLNGLAVSNGLANIIVKAVKKEEITALDVFQFTSAFLFFTHSVITTHQAMSMLKGMGENSSGGPTDGIEASMKGIFETVESTETCNILPGAIVRCSPTVSIIAGVKGLSLLSICSVVSRTLKEITKSLLSGLTNMYNCMLEVGRLLSPWWESWNKEMAEVVDIICRAFGVKHWSELVIKGCNRIEYGHIRAIAGTVIAEKKSLVDCGNTAMPSHQGQDISDNSAVVGTDYGPNSLVDEETPTVSYYEEVTNIHKKFVDQQKCKDPAELCKYMTFIYKFVRRQLQKKKSNYEKNWEMVKNFVGVEDFKKQYGISGNLDNHFLQEVFNDFKNEEEDAFTFLQLSYMKQNAGTSPQEEQHAQGFIDAEGVRFYPFYSMCGMARNGMPSKQQYREKAVELMGRHADSYSICMSLSGDAAFIKANDAADVMMVQCWPEDGKVSGIAAVLCASD